MRASSSTVTVACVQMRSGLERAQNVVAASDLITTAAKAGAKFVATPEMTNVVDRKPSRLLKSLPGEGQLEEIRSFASLAQSLNIWLLIGSMAVLVDDLDAEYSESGHKQAYNRAYLFSPHGELVTHYDKIHMFDVDLPNGESWKESAVYKPGTKARIAKTDIGTLGLSICYDLRFPYLYNSLASQGAEILCIPAAFTRQTGKAHWETLLRARAIECGAFVMAPAQGGIHEDGRETWGHSMIIDPWGKIIAQSDHDAPDIVIGEIDLAEVATARQRIPNLQAKRDFSVSI